MKIPVLLLCILIPPLLSAETAPAKFLDLSTWKLTLPVAEEAGGNAKEIKQPVLSTYEHPEYFFTDTGKKAVIFRAPCGGATTKGSKYPRSELREMTGDGRERASWKTDDGNNIHRMTLKVAINRTPEVKKHVVCAQIHDAGDDLMMIRLEGKHLFVERKPHEDVSIDHNYVLGTPFEIEIEAHEGRVKVTYNGKQKMDWKVSAKGCYFKAGCYTQSNTTKGDSADSYGEVAIQELKIFHGFRVP